MGNGLAKITFKLLLLDLEEQDKEVLQKAHKEIDKFAPALCKEMGK